MPIFYGMQIVLDLLCAIHIHKTGRPYWWIGIVLMVPGLGALAYFLFEVMPNIGADRHLKRVIRHFDPGMDLRKRLEEVERCGSVQNKASLADELINAGQFRDAIRLYQSAMEGQHAEDIHLAFGLATAHFWNGDAPAALLWLDKVIVRDGWYKSGAAKLLRARALDGHGDPQGALDQYQAIVDNYTGEEVRCRMILLLTRLGRTGQAKQVFAEMEKKMRLAPPYYRKEQQTFVKEASKALAAAGASST